MDVIGFPDNNNLYCHPYAPLKLIVITEVVISHVAELLESVFRHESLSAVWPRSTCNLLPESVLAAELNCGLEI